MKKWIAMLLAVLMTVTMTAGYAESAEGIRLELGMDTFSKTLEADGRVYAEASYMGLVLLPGCAEKYPELATLVAQLNRESGEKCDAFLEEVAQYYQESEQKDTVYYTYEQELYVQRADSRMLSVMVNLYAYTGGAHPTQSLTAVNIDPETARVLDIDDLFTDVPAVLSKVAERIQEQYAGVEFEDLQGQLASYEEQGHSCSFGPQGVTFCFPPYALAAYAVGQINVTFLYDELKDLIQEKYTADAQGGFIRQIPLYNEIVLDVQGDGAADALTVFTSVSEEDENIRENLRIILNDQEYADPDFYAFDMKAYVVTVEAQEGVKTYLYLESTSENDYATLDVFDLNGEEIKRTGSMSGSRFPAEWNGEEAKLMEYIPVRSEQFLMETRMDVLGTLGVYQFYSTDAENGLPVPQDTVYQLSPELDPYTSLVPLTVLTIPDGAQEEIPAGTSFSFLRTDGETFVEMGLVDGRECRLEIQITDGGVMINGVPESECFDGIFYAG